MFYCPYVRIHEARISFGDKDLETQKHRRKLTENDIQKHL